MSAMASQITSLMIVYLTVYSGVDQRNHKSSAALAFVPGIHIDGLVEERRNSITNALELCLSRTNPST